MEITAYRVWVNVEAEYGHGTGYQDVDGVLEGTAVAVFESDELDQAVAFAQRLQEHGEQMPAYDKNGKVKHR